MCVAVPGMSREAAALHDTWAAENTAQTTTLVPPVRPAEFKAKRGMRSQRVRAPCSTAFADIPLMCDGGGGGLQRKMCTGKIYQSSAPDGAR